jgi:hypothetical protein
MLMDAQQTLQTSLVEQDLLLGQLALGDIDGETVDHLLAGIPIDRIIRGQPGVHRNPDPPAVLPFPLIFKMVDGFRLSQQVDEFLPPLGIDIELAGKHGEIAEGLLGIGASDDPRHFGIDRQGAAIHGGAENTEG